jgi:hypothetical protein
MTITIPDNIKDEFLILLDYVQSLFDEKEEAEFTDEEKKCLKFVRKLLDDKVDGGRSYAPNKIEVKKCPLCGGMCEETFE